MYAHLTVFYYAFELCFNYVGNFQNVSKFFMAKSQRTRIRLRGDTFGGSQSKKKLTYTSPNNLKYLQLETEKKVQSPTLNDH